MTFTYKEDEFRFQNLTALVSTSRGAEFLSAFDNPARGQEAEVQAALRALFEEVLEVPAGDPVSRPRVEARTSIDVKMDESIEIYRFMRVMAALEQGEPIAQRRMLIARLAAQPLEPEQRLDRMERATMPEATRDQWKDLFPGKRP